MDELEILKKDWNKKENQNFPRLSYNDIYKMLLKKSSSIVKWIFIISILEFLFWTILSFAFKDYEGFEYIKDTNIKYTFYGISILNYIVLLYFFYLFYKNYKRISVTDNAKTLMETILKTRQTVKYYVTFNLVLLVVGTILTVGIMITQDTESSHSFMFYCKIILITGIILIIIIALLLGFYWLIYGILLKRLDKNYKELYKMDL